MARVEYEVKGSVALVRLNDGENRFNPDFLSEFLGVLDTVENGTDARTLVVTSAHEKIFSNGIDLDWLTPVIHKEDFKTARAYFYQLNALFKRLVTYPLIAIAAINGHAFAGGAIMSCAFDFRFMRSDRGFFCFPEVDLGIPFLPGMNALLKKAIPLYKVEEMEYTGCRLTAEQCVAHHIMTAAYAKDELLEQVLRFADGLNKRRAVVAELKKRLNSEIVRIIDVEDIPYIESNKFNIG